jgi:hypothetical protein
MQLLPVSSNIHAIGGSFIIIDKILEAKRRDEICLSSPKTVEPLLVFEMKDPYGIWIKSGADENLRVSMVHAMKFQRRKKKNENIILIKNHTLITDVLTAFGNRLCLWKKKICYIIYTFTGRGVVLAIFYVFYPIFLRSSRETFVSPHYYFA